MLNYHAVVVFNQGKFGPSYSALSYQPDDRVLRFAEAKDNGLHAASSSLILTAQQCRALALALLGVFSDPEKPEGTIFVTTEEQQALFVSRDYGALHLLDLRPEEPPTPGPWEVEL